MPYTRGAEYSRSVNEILDEAKRLVDGGALEITLLGQNVNAFHGTGPDGSTWNLASLMHKISEIDGLKRIRYTTSHPRDMDDDLIAAHGEIEMLQPFLHLPVQSGSDKILEAMNRKHTRDLYFDIIERMRKSRPDITFSSDFIVGFPGETDQDFEDTMDMINRVGFVSTYSFIFSARPGTPAANMSNLVRPDIASQRLARLQALINEQQIAFNRNSVGVSMPILFDRKGKKPGQIMGRSPYSQSVYIEGPDSLLNTLSMVKITEGFDNSLTGVLESENIKTA